MKKNITADTLAVLMLFAVFVLSVFSVLIYGANVYRKTAEASYFNYTERTCLSYITQKIRHYDQKDCVKTENINGTDALVLKENIDGTIYNTYIYCDNGYVKELFCEDGYEFVPSDGMEIIEADSLTFEYAENNIIKISCTGKDGISETVYAFVKGGKEAELK